ncbi:MAG TPA: tRNA uridine(34) 5-carboxymethylaminomethyl modification radical SAM/GNAT enzyme Elp3 [Candidatus Paceibacterota bacterium]|nr:tRNA uridine(34) 5-carboxymethylaminomethyl modification radical SAM/GNAT enzyme Elp3 [Candidatus Paceibacterota bacterium]
MSIDPNEIIIKNLIKINAKNQSDLAQTKREIAKHYKVPCPSNIKLLEVYHNLLYTDKIEKNENLENLLIKRKIRSLSGVVVVSVLTKPYPCPGKCIYCPKEKGIPKSYLSGEPAVERAKKLNFDPYLQVKKRLEMLQNEGHPTDKIELRIIGGSWSCYPKDYKQWFITKCFEAANKFNKNSKFQIPNFKQVSIAEPCKSGQDARRDEFSLNSKQGVKRGEASLNSKQGVKRDEASLNSKQGAKRDEASLSSNIQNLKQEQKRNETAKHRIVGISIETRPDLINEKEIKELRKLGVTLVEIGVQTIFDDVLKKCQRDHSVKEVIEATKLLKDAGFKVLYQMMPNLPGSTIQKDLATFKELFENPHFKPDWLKIYPCVVCKESKLYQLWEKGKYQSYSDEELINLLIKIKEILPYWVRVARLFRDIPSSKIQSGSKVSNLREVVLNKLNQDGKSCHCIRCREVRENYNPKEKIYLKREDYDASGGKEIFLSFENKNRTKLFAFLRLRIPSFVFSREKHFLPVLQDAAIIREIHTYGALTPFNKKTNLSPQHQGMGRALIKEAEYIVKNEFRLPKIAVISGVGVRNYWRKLGYRLNNTYMVKNQIL